MANKSNAGKGAKKPSPIKKPRVAKGSKAARNPMSQMGRGRMGY